jgi:hypothetical protein
MAELMSNDSRRNQNGYHSGRLDADDPTAQLAIHEQLVRQLVRSFCIAKSLMITFSLRKLLYAST